MRNVFLYFFKVFLMDKNESWRKLALKKYDMSVCKLLKKSHDYNQKRINLNESFWVFSMINMGYESTDNYFPLILPCKEGHKLIFKCFGTKISGIYLKYKKIIFNNTLWQIFVIKEWLIYSIFILRLIKQKFSEIKQK